MRRNSPESLPWRHECLGRGGEGVTDPEQLGGDAEGDFVGVVGADGFADGAKEVFGAFGGEAVGHEFAAEDSGFGGAADGSEKREIALGEGALEDGAVAGVAFRYAEDEGVGGERGDEVGGVFVRDGAERAGGGEAGEPVGARVDHGERAGERQEDGDEGLDDVTGAEDHEGPWAGGGVGLEVEFHGAAASHADIGFKTPVDEARAGGAGGEELLREGDGLGFDAATADGAGEQAGGSNEHLGPGVLRGAAERINEHDEHEGGGFAFEGGELLVEGGHLKGGRGGSVARL